MVKTRKEIPVVTQLHPQMLSKTRGVHSPRVNTLLVVWHSQSVDMVPQTNFTFMGLVERPRIANDHTFPKCGGVEVDFRCVLGE